MPIPNAAPNLHRTSTILHSCLQTLIIVPLSSPSAIKPSPTAKYSSVQSVCCHLCAPVPQFSCIVMSADLVCQSYGFLTTSGQTSDSRWVYLGPTRWHCSFQREISLMCFSSAAACFLGRPQSLQFLTLHVFLMRL